MKKRILSLALSLTLVLGLVGALPAYAEERGGKIYSNEPVGSETVTPYYFDTTTYKYFLKEGESALTLELKPEDVMYLSNAPELRQFAQYINAGGASQVDGEPLTWRLNGGRSDRLAVNENSNDALPMIGTKSHPFSGVFDGNGQTLALKSISVGSGSEVMGLFGYLKGAEIRDLVLKMTSLAIDKKYVGMLAAYAGENSVITGCTVSVSALNVGGTALTYLGGVVGYAENSSILNCNGTGSISANGTVGGIVGYAKNSTVSGCSFDGRVSSSDRVAGGVVGEAVDTNITDCGNSDEISGAVCAGGIVGKYLTEHAEKEISGCYNTGAVKGNESAGGIVGRMELDAPATVTESFNSGPISSVIIRGSVSTDPTCGNGGIVGSVSEGTTDIQYCYNTGEIYNNGKVATQSGGISGWGGNLNGCYSAAPRKDTSGDPLAPVDSGATFIDCYYDSCLFSIPPDPKWPTGIPGGKFINGKPLSGDLGSFTADSQVWTFDEKSYPQLKSMAGLPAAQSAVAPRPGGYIDIGTPVYDGRPITVGQTEQDDVRYWLIGGYELGSMTFSAVNGNQIGRPTEDRPTAAGTYLIKATFTADGKEEITLQAQLTIAKRALAESDFNAGELTAAELYTGSAIPKTVTCAEGLTLAEGTDYTVALANNVDDTHGETKATVTVTAAGTNCTGTVTFPFEIYLSDTGEGRVVPTASGLYRLGADGTWTCGEDPTVYQGGVPVYLEQDNAYTFTKRP